MGLSGAASASVSAWRQPRGLVLQAGRLGLLLLIAGADCNTQVVEMAIQAALVAGAAPEVAVRAVGQPAAAAPGGAVQRAVFVQCPKPGGPETVALSWLPPAGATAVTFLDAQPDNPQGPPPFQFASVAVSDSGDPQAAASVQVSYLAPAPPQPPVGATFVDVFTAVTPAGNAYSATFEDSLATNGAGAAGRAAVEGGAAGASLARSSESAEAYQWWRAHVTLSPGGSLPIDQALCQDLAAFVQADAFFVALRFPVATPDVADARSARLPLVVPATPADAPVARLVAPPPATTVFELPLELRPGRIAFAESALPQAAGERWLAFAASAQGEAICPAALSGAWQLEAELPFDFGGTPSSCAECVLEAYLCWEGSEPPFLLGAAATGPGSVTAQSTYRGMGTTCTGPIPVRLAGEVPTPPFALEQVGLARALSNTVVAFAHRVRGWLAPEETLDVDLGVASSRGFRWSLYRDSAGADPITGPVTISGSAPFDFWARSRLPLGVRGPESVTITATSAVRPDEQAWTADHLWVGAWSAPPPAPELHVETPVLQAGGQVSAAGALPDGSYRLAVVPNGAYLPGECYAGEVLASADVVVEGATLPSTVVWAGAAAGAYDVLALAGACAGGAAGAAMGAATGAVIMIGADLSASAGFEVTPPAAPLRRRLRRR